MGKIPTRRRNTARIYQPILKTWLNIIPRRATTQMPLNQQAPAHSGLKERLQILWHTPDTFSWMEPLPGGHRRAILLMLFIIFAAILWPSPREQYLPIQPPTRINNIPLSAQLLDPVDQPNTVTERPTASSNTTWQSYHIQSGQTLAQLFRNNDLMVSDVFAMARVEGDDKPLSNLKAGQEVKIQRNAKGVVTALEIPLESNNRIRFSRQSDGSYRRDR